MFRRRNEVDPTERMLKNADFIPREDIPSYRIWDHWNDGRILIVYDDGGWRVAGTKTEGRTRVSLLNYLTKGE